jgi:hypothetical protein
MKQVV